jgi:hypothetical protein
MLGCVHGMFPRSTSEAARADVRVGTARTLRRTQLRNGPPRARRGCSGFPAACPDCSAI